MSDIYRKYINGVIRHILAIVLCTMILSTVNFAADFSLEGGVKGDPLMKDGSYEYEEMFFLTGEPIKLKGELTISGGKDEKAIKYTKSYKYDLYSTDQSIHLSRNISFNVMNELNNAMHQTTSKIDIGKITENIDVGGKKYNLASYLYDGSTLTDNTTAVDYFNGSLYAKKKYYVNGNQLNNEGVLTVEFTGDNIIGYRHLWGDSETRILTYELRFVSDPEVKNSDLDWSGQVVLKTNQQTRTRLEYSSTDPQTISFRGNYVKRTREEGVLQYSYDLPKMAEGKVDKEHRNIGKGDLRKDIIIDAHSLITAKMRDIEGHVAQDDIQRVTSLQILSPEGSFFDPDLPISRFDFAKAITKSIADIKPYTRTELIKRDRNKEEQLFFYDVDQKDPNLSYIEFVHNHKLMVGKDNYFMGDKTLSRAEAISIMISAIGMNHLAPAPPYRTIYTDDEYIPLWAKDSIYVATEIGLIKPFEDGGCHSMETVTRAEAAQMLDDFIGHINDNITYDYREKIINRY